MYHQCIYICIYIISGADESMCDRISIKIVRKIQAKEELIEKLFCLLFFFPPPLLEEHTKMQKARFLKK